MGMARGETSGDRGAHRARGEPVAAPAITAATAYDERGEALAAEDIVHEAFVRLLAELAAGRPPRQMRARLYRVVSNLAVSRARHRGVASRRAGALASRELAPSAEDQLLERELTLDLNDRPALLPEDARTALVLAAHGYSRAEFARRIGRSELATRSMLCRSRSRLRHTAAA